MASLLKPVMFLMLATLSMGIPLFEESLRLKRSLFDSYNQSELACFKQLKILYTDGNCYLLNRRPPCPNNHMLVMNKEVVVLPNGKKRSYPVCKRNPCMQYKVFWPVDNKCYSSARDRGKLCPFKANIVITNSWGEGECACEPTHARHEVDVLNGKGTYAEFEGDCYPLYYQGPCLANQIFNATLTDDGQIFGRCVPNPCQEKFNQNPGSAFGQLTPGGTCYKIGKTGSPCSSNEMFSLHPDTKELTCVNLNGSAVMLTLFGNSTLRCGGNYNHLNECRKSLEIREKRYIIDINRQRVDRRTRPGA